MPKEPKPDLENYNVQQDNNQRMFMEMLKQVKPDLWVLADVIEQTRVNTFVLIKVIRQLNNIAIGNGWGDVTIEIQNGVVKFIRGTENDRIEEPIVMKPKL